MSDIKNPKAAIPVVLLAGILWSFGPYVVRNIDQPQLVTWQYLFTRGMVVFILLNVYLYLNEGLKFYKNYLKIGISGLLGGVVSLSSASIVTEVSFSIKLLNLSIKLVSL